MEDEYLETRIEPLKTDKPANHPRRPNSVVMADEEEREVMKTEASSCSCNCQRPIASIRCEAWCGFTLLGRLSLPCPVHTGHRHLMDHQPTCPDCGQRLGKLLSRNEVQSDLPSIIFNSQTILFEFNWKIKNLTFVCCHCHYLYKVDRCREIQPARRSQ